LRRAATRASTAPSGRARSLPAGAVVTKFATGLARPSATAPGWPRGLNDEVGVDKIGNPNAPATRSTLLDVAGPSSGVRSSCIARACRAGCDPRRCTSPRSGPVRTERGEAPAFLVDARLRLAHALLDVLARDSRTSAKAFKRARQRPQLGRPPRRRAMRRISRQHDLRVARQLPRRRHVAPEQRVQPIAIGTRNRIAATINPAHGRARVRRVQRAPRRRDRRRAAGMSSRRRRARAPTRQHGQGEPCDGRDRATRGHVGHAESVRRGTAIRRASAARAATRSLVENGLVT